MTDNILVTIFYDDEWIEILQRLEEKCNWKLRYIVGFPEMETRIRTVFDGVLFEDVGVFLTGLEISDGKLAESPDITALPEIPFDFELLEKLSKYEFMIKYMINREYDKGHDRTNEIYFDLIKYWLRIIGHTKPSLVIVPYTPYTAREYVIYALSQICGIKFLSFRRATVGYYLNIPISNPNNIQFDAVVLKYNHLKTKSFHEIYIQDYADKKIESISDLTRTNILDKPNQVLESSVHFNKFDVIYNHYLGTLKSVKELRGKSLIRKIWFDINNTGKIFSSVEKFSDLKSSYDMYCTNPDFTKPYVFFPLHYQPEQTTSPFGNYSVYQYLPIEMLARSLPEGWFVYVKEHHTTFSPFHEGLKKRSPDYYKRLVESPCVKLIPVEIPSAVLIDNAKVIATITGSAGYEGLLRGKPVITFGSAWYNGCAGVFPISTHTGCKQVLDQIQNNIQIDPSQIRLFVEATEFVGFKVNYSFSMKGIGDNSISREDTIHNMTVGISEWWDTCISTQ